MTVDIECDEGVGPKSNILRHRTPTSHDTFSSKPLRNQEVCRCYRQTLRSLWKGMPKGFCRAFRNGIHPLCTVDFSLIKKYIPLPSLFSNAVFACLTHFWKRNSCVWFFCRGLADVGRSDVVGLFGEHSARWHDLI